MALAMMVLCVVVSIALGISAARGAGRGGMVDFQGLYYPTRFLLQGHDPYNRDQLRAYYRQEATHHPPGFLDHPEWDKIHVNLPTASLVIAPFTLASWYPAQAAWTLVLALLLLAASDSIWRVSAGDAPRLALLLVCFMLANSIVLFGGGNAAGPATSLAVLGVWCFLRSRHLALGSLCFAVGLLLKPHDVGFLWLYFLLSQGVQRKYALRALAITAVASVASWLWIVRIAPSWFSEWSANVAVSATTGGSNDPGPGASGGIIIGLQAVIALFRDVPVFYTSLTWIICVPLLLLWGATALHARGRAYGWLAMAGIVPLSLVVTYHRPYDAKLLLLSIPACAELWRRGGPLARWAVALSTTAIILTSDLPLFVLQSVGDTLASTQTGWAALAIKMALVRPAPLVLLAMSMFYICLYVKAVWSPNVTSPYPLALEHISVGREGRRA
jgi:hypothetical protein